MRTAVLLVDDDEFARGFVRSVLERAGFEVHEAEDLATAFDLARTHPPRAVVTDWNLPDGNGGDLARRLRGEAQDLPIILVTGESPAADPLLSFVGNEFRAILHKPFAPSALESAIRAAVG